MRTKAERERLFLVLAILSLLFMGGCLTDIKAPNLSDLEDSGTAIQCEESCSGETSYCDEESGRCVECLEASHCSAMSEKNYAGICTSDHTCDYDEEACAEGYFSRDGDYENGCLCMLEDLPDLEGGDTNCDGVDGVWEGDLANAVFVSAEKGDDALHDGLSPEEPKKSLRVAISVAVGKQRPYVLVAAGEYVEQVTLADGISIYGGYNPDDWSRNVEVHKTVITGKSSLTDDIVLPATYISGENAYKTIIASGLTRETVLSGLKIVGTDDENSSDSQGASTYGVWSLNSENLKIEHSVVTGGRAAHGKGGENGETLQCTPHTGGQGGGATDKSPCDMNPNLRAESGLMGNADVIQEKAAGGDGGIHQCLTQDLPKSRAGVPGSDGKSGGNGSHGVSAAENDRGTFGEDGRWIAPAGAAAEAGQKGGGGGGGGAEGNWAVASGPLSIKGKPGSAGGAGGCGGEGGEAGQAGGSSFAIAVVGGNIELANVELALGQGGNGGTGGNGGKGSNGQPGEDNYPSSGKGGKGGDGGWGGSGPGGDGGHGVGIALSHGATLTSADLRYEQRAVTSSLGGAGGQSAEGSGQGKPGDVVEQLSDLSE